MIAKSPFGKKLAIGGIAPIAGLALAWFLLTPHSSTTSGQTANKLAAADGQLLYRTHCASCHGEQGDGNGIAARFLYPRPRDFTGAEYRLVSTTNLIPTDDDLLQVISRGMPGSAMMPFGHLPEDERKALVAYVRDLTQAGMLRRTVADAKGRGETPDEGELRREISEFLKPGSRLDQPGQWPASDQASIARGQALYGTNCATCHGATGRGDGAQDQKDASGMPTRPRDFSRGIFKGGREREQLYARIVLGMKGTPMPGNSQLKPEEIGDIVNFIQSLAPADAQAKIEHRRKAVSVRRLGGALPESLSAVWPNIAETPIVVSPLWWRDYPDADFRVSAVHDGTTIAVRLSWNDATLDEVVGAPEQFEDMAAVQLFRGKPEPFLGMGAGATAIDLWLWRASWHRPKEEKSALDEYPFDTAFYRDRAKGQPLPDFATAKAAGNQHSHADAGQSAGNLAAKGLGSTTFRPKASQVVTARSSWSNGRWSVEFRRPLKVATDAGVSLAPGEEVSIAFALWDGTVRDRNGQKQVSIWHDFKIE